MTTPDDQRGAARVATISALIVVAAFVAGKAARDAILLTHFSIQTLPLFIGIAALLSFPVILLAGRLMTRFGPARLVPVLNVVSAAAAIGEWVLLGRYPRVIAVTVFIHLSTASAVLVSGFWSIVNERFDIQTAKRHIGRIGMGATLGGIFGGVVAERTAVYLEPDMILLVLAGLQLVTAATLFAFGRGSAPSAVEAPSEGTWTALRHAARAPLFRNVGLIVVLGAVAAGLMDYVFKADIVASASEGGLLRALAVFYTVTNILTAVIQLTVCGPIISHLGVPRSVATLPVAVTAFSLVALAVPIPLTAAFARASELVMRNSIYRSGYELLYAPLAEERKRPTKVVLDVGADKVGDILGAQLVGLIVFAAIDVRTLLLMATVITGVLMLLFAMRLPRSYTKALEESLLVHAAEVVGSESPANAQPEPWLSLTGMPTFGNPDGVPLRTRSRSRRGAAPIPSRPPASEQVPPRDPAPGSPSSAPPAGQVGSSSPSTAPLAGQVANGPSPSAPLAGQLANGPSTSAPAAPQVGNSSERQGSPVPLPRGIATSSPRPTSPEKVQGANDLIVTLVADLRSSDVERVRHALAGQIVPEVAAHVVELVGRDDVGREAAIALAPIANVCTGALVDALLDQNRPINLRRRIPAILVLGEPRLACWALWKGLADPDFDVRYRTGAVLAKLAAEGHLAYVSEDEVYEAVRRELPTDPAEWKKRELVEDTVAGAHAGADEVRVSSGLEHVFRVLGLVLPAEPLRIALHAMQVDDPELRGTALEYLESILPTDVRAQLWPLLEAGEPAVKEAVASAADAATSHDDLERQPSASQPPKPLRSMDQLLAELSGAYPAVVSRLKQRRNPT